MNNVNKRIIFSQNGRTEYESLNDRHETATGIIANAEGIVQYNSTENGTADEDIGPVNSDENAGHNNNGNADAHGGNTGDNNENEGAYGGNAGDNNENEGAYGGNAGKNNETDGARARNEGAHAGNDGARIQNEDARARNEVARAGNYGARIQNEDACARNDGARVENGDALDRNAIDGQNGEDAGGGNEYQNDLEEEDEYFAKVEFLLSCIYFYENATQGHALREKENRYTTNNGQVINIF